jgi:hypothetical protein
MAQAAADKGYHVASNSELSDSLDVRTYISKLKRKHRLKVSNKSKTEQRALQTIADGESARRARHCNGVGVRWWSGRSCTLVRQVNHGAVIFVAWGM